MGTERGGCSRLMKTPRHNGGAVHSRSMRAKKKDNARKAFEKYNRRLEDLKDFIKLAKEELAKREEAAGHERDNTNS